MSQYSLIPNGAPERFGLESQRIDGELSEVSRPSRWQEFLDNLFPWLKHKRDLAEKLLAAEVQKRAAEAWRTEAEARLADAKALKERLEAKEIADRVNSQPRDGTHCVRPEDLEAGEIRPGPPQ